MVKLITTSLGLIAGAIVLVAVNEVINDIVRYYQKRRQPRAWSDTEHTMIVTGSSLKREK